MKFLQTMLVSALALLAPLTATGSAHAADAVLSKTWDQIVADAKSEGELTFYAWWGEEFWRDAAKDFEAKYGIKVNVIIGDNTATVGKIVAETPNATGTIDATLVGGVSLKLLLDANSLLGPIAPVIPDTDKLDAKLSVVHEGYATGGYLVPVYRNQVGFLYDPEKLATPPQTWAEFTAWLDANPGQFAFNDPSKGGSGQAFVQAALVNTLGGDQIAYDGATEVDPALTATWTKAWDWFNLNEDKFLITGSNSDSADRVNQGEVTMAAQWDDDTAIALAKGTLFKRAKLYIPAFGLPGGGDSLGIPANAPHKDAALLFVAYLIQPEVQVQLNKTIGSYLARTDVSGESAILPETERQQNGRPWLPGVYKSLYIEQFVSQVLQK
ncbi:extracellular solute-binding protein [uncultured Devosia sp.]|uniref:extracellular solute-binding protein n=1 Tax=uncultured Devosia sp. TaxID=211434 RepID=UPI0035CB85E5